MGGFFIFSPAVAILYLTFYASYLKEQIYNLKKSVYNIKDPVALRSTIVLATPQTLTLTTPIMTPIHCTDPMTPPPHPQLLSMKVCSGKKVQKIKVAQNDPFDSSSQKIDQVDSEIKDVR